MKCAYPWMRLVQICLLAVVTLCAATTSAQSADLRYRVAVLDFDVNDLSGEVVSPLGLGRAMATEFQTPLVRSGRFTVITRLDLEKVLDELALGPTGILNPDQVQAFGEIAGVDIIITGNITVFSGNSYSISATFINVATGEVAHAATLRVAAPEEFLEAARGFVEGALVRFPLQGAVLAIDGTATYINIGILHGLTSNDQTGTIYRPREVAGRSIPLRIGTFTIGQIYQDVALIVPDVGDEFTLQVGDIVIVQPLEEQRSATSELTLVSVDVDVSPESAQVFVNGDLMTFPAQFEPGLYLAIVRAEGYLEKTVEIDTRSLEALMLNLTLEPVLATVAFEIAPVDATVWIDEELLVGRTANLAFGEHSLLVEAPGYQPLHDVLVVDQSVAVYEAQLDPHLARIVIGDSLSGHSISVDGRHYGEVGEIQLPPGEYFIEISVDGRPLIAESVSLGPAEQWELPGSSETTAPVASGGESGQAPATSPSEAEVPPPSTSTEGAPATGAEIAPTTEPMLVISSNAIPTIISLEGPVSHVIELLESPSELALPDGIYLVSAESPGRPSIDTVAVISREDANFLEFSFEGRLAEVYLGPYRTTDGIGTLVRVESLTDADMARIVVNGPPGWNGDTPASQDIELDGSFHVISSSEFVPGTYTVRLSTPATGEIAFVSTYEQATALALVGQVRLSLGADENQLLASWTAVPGAESYLVELSGGSTQSVVTGNTSVTFRAQVRRSSEFTLCLAAMDWATTAPIDTPSSVSRRCQSFDDLLPDTRTSRGRDGDSDHSDPRAPSGPMPLPPIPPPPP